MGWSGLHRSAGETNVTLPSVDQTATLTTPSVSAPNLNTPTGSLPGLSFAPLSIVRSGNGFTLTGDLPDLNAKNALLDTLRGTIGADVNLTDNLNIKAGVSAPDFTGLGGLFKAAVDIPDFNFDLNGEVLELVHHSSFGSPVRVRTVDCTTVAPGLGRPVSGAMTAPLGCAARRRHATTCSSVVGEKSA